MIRIPVRKVSGIFKFCIAALCIFLITEDVVCQGKSRNAALYSLRLFEDPYSAYELIIDRFIYIRIFFAVSFFFELRKKLGSRRSVIKMGFQFCELVIGHYDPGMTLFPVLFDHGTDDIGAAGKGSVITRLQTECFCRSRKNMARQYADNHDKHDQDAKQFSLHNFPSFIV